MFLFFHNSACAVWKGKGTADQVFICACACVYVLKQNVALWMWHHWKEVSHFFSSISLHSRTKCKLFDLTHPNKIPLSPWNSSSKLNNTWNISGPGKVSFMGFPDNYCLCFSIYPQLHRTRFTASIDHPTRGHRSHRTYRNRKSNFLSPLQYIETCFLFTSQIGKPLS